MLSNDVFQIEPGESSSLVVSYDPTISHQEKKTIKSYYDKLVISHLNHDRVDNVDLFVDINYPNISIIPSKLNFGCLLNDTIKKQFITVENISNMDVDYTWYLLEDDNTYEVVNKRKKDIKKIPLNEVFSIVPMNGLLKKGEKEQVEITFNPMLS
jgi:hypothetical protein